MTMTATHWIGKGAPPRTEDGDSDLRNNAWSERRTVVWGNGTWEIVHNDGFPCEPHFARHRGTDEAYGLEWRNEAGRWVPISNLDDTDLYNYPSAIRARRLRVAGCDLILRPGRKEADDG